jgi:hypothetical protein
VASEKTIEEVIKVLCKHVPDQEVVRDIVRDLLKVKGNKSFRDTIQAIASVVLG